MYWYFEPDFKHQKGEIDLSQMHTPKLSKYMYTAY